MYKTSDFFLFPNKNWRVNPPRRILTGRQNAWEQARTRVWSRIKIVFLSQCHSSRCVVVLFPYSVFSVHSTNCWLLICYTICTLSLPLVLFDIKQRSTYTHLRCTHTRNCPLWRHLLTSTGPLDSGHPLAGFNLLQNVNVTRDSRMIYCKTRQWKILLTPKRDVLQGI